MEESNVSIAIQTDASNYGSVYSGESIAHETAPKSNSSMFNTVRKWVSIACGAVFVLCILMGGGLYANIKNVKGSIDISGVTFVETDHLAGEGDHDHDDGAGASYYSCDAAPTSSLGSYYWCYSSIDECNTCYHTVGCGDSACTDLCEWRGSSWCYTSDACFGYESIVTRLVGGGRDQFSINNNGVIDTEEVMIKDIKLNDFVLTDINRNGNNNGKLNKNQFSKVIDRTHYTAYDGVDKKAQMRQLCIDDIAIDDDNLLVDEMNCILLTYDHLIYINGVSVDSLKQSGEAKIGDYLFNVKLNKYVEIIKINENVSDYYRNIITESGNIVVNNGIYSSTIPSNIKFENHKTAHLVGVYEGMMSS